MKRAAVLFLSLFLGIAVAEFLSTNFVFRQSLGRIVRRGELEVLVGRRGIFDRDIEHALRAQNFAGRQPSKTELLARLIDLAKLEEISEGQSVAAETVDHEMDLLRWQFADEKSWNAAQPSQLRREVLNNLRARAWLEAQLGAKILPNEKQRRQFYDAYPDVFFEPLRFRASHIFLAAPDGYPAEVIEAKRALTQAIVARQESFPALVAEFSEDDATKNREGYLNYFAAERMLPEIFAAAQALPLNAMSAPIRSRLGFHLLRVTQVLPPARLSFAEVEPEIAAFLENQQRAPAIVALLGKMQFATQRK
jgi:parvulin-like peptidyl-prolyl isomerase